MDELDRSTKTVAGRWLKIAKIDPEVAGKLLTGEERFSRPICFHSQQCFEKALKAVLAVSGKFIHKSHYLPQLLQECLAVVPELRQFESAAIRMFPYAIRGRYPGDLSGESDEGPSFDQAIAALKDATILFETIRGILEQQFEIKIIEDI